MAEPQLLAILIVIGFFLATFAGAAFLIHRVMTRPDFSIGAKARRFEEESFSREIDEYNASAGSSAVPSGTADAETALDSQDSRSSEASGGDDPASADGSGLEEPGSSGKESGEVDPKNPGTSGSGDPRD